MKAKIIETSEIKEVKETYLNSAIIYQDLEGTIYNPYELDLCFDDKGYKGIKELSSEYSEHVCPPEDYIDDEERSEDVSMSKEMAKDVLEWLAGNYIITLTPRKNINVHRIYQTDHR